MPQHKNLPEPTEEAKLFSQTLSQKIHSTLKRYHSLSFSKYMEMALYAPGLGYYSAGLPKFGREGDFITAPEISPIFSRCLARQVAPILAELEQANVVEFGAGSGAMAEAILLELAELAQLPQRYYIVEISADLKARQQQRLQNNLPESLYRKVHWLEKLPSTKINAVVLANEVLDAMPVEKIRIEPEQALQGFVTFNAQSQQFDWDYRPITDNRLQKFANQLIKHIGKVSHLGYETEINLNIRPWLKSLYQILNQGAVLLIDYGYNREEYYQAARVMGTLRCHYQHRAHQNPFFYPGLQDITAHVDFTAVAESAFDVGFKIAGYTTQANFLIGTGLMEMAVDPSLSVEQQVKTSQQIKTLTLPDEMGESFKVIALTKDCETPLSGFKVRDLRHQL